MRTITSIILFIFFQSVSAQNINAYHNIKAGLRSFTIKKFSEKTIYWFNSARDSIMLDGTARWYKSSPHNQSVDQIYFTLVDTNQQFLLNFQFACNSGMTANALNTDIDSSFLLVFDYYGDTLRINDSAFISNNNGRGAFCVTKIKKDGSIIFCKSFQGYASNAQVAALPDGKITVSGSTGYSDMTFDGLVLPAVGMGIVSDADFFVAILDSTGQVLHVRRFGGTSWDYCNHLLITDDGSIYLTGSFYSSKFKIDSLTLTNPSGGKFGLPDAILLKLDSTLHPVWAKHVRGYGGQRGFLVDMDAVGKLYWGFSYTNYQSYLEEETLHGNLDNAMICQLDTAGNIIWKRSFATSNAAYLSSISFSPNQNFWLSVNYQDSLRFGNNLLSGVAKDDQALVEMNPQGEFLRWFNITGPSSAYINYVQAVGDQQLFVAGSTDSLSFLNLHIPADPVYDRIYFHFILNLNTVSTEQPAQEAVDLAVFPNPVPAGGLLKVDMHGTTHQGQAILYDAMGRVVTQTRVPDYATQMTFPAPRQAGMYYLTLQAGEQRVVRKIVVEK